MELTARVSRFNLLIPARFRSDLEENKSHCDSLLPTAFSFAELVALTSPSLRHSAPTQCQRDRVESAYLPIPIRSTS